MTQQYLLTCTICFNVFYGNFVTMANNQSKKEVRNKSVNNIPKEKIKNKNCPKDEQRKYVKQKEYKGPKAP